MQKYGKTESDLITEQKIQCREIVKEILDFGVNEMQKRQIIKLLSLELESVSLMKEIAGLLRDQEEKDSSKKLLTLQ
tara:strand:+ start:641 stop:871 length:231 start_codon:yes stop_codon:yes gene_type:complete